MSMKISIILMVALITLINFDNYVNSEEFEENSSKDKVQAIKEVNAKNFTEETRDAVKECSGDINSAKCTQQTSIGTEKTVLKIVQNVGKGWLITKNHFEINEFK